MFGRVKQLSPFLSCGYFVSHASQPHSRLTMNRQRPLPPYNPLYEFNRQTPYPNNHQSPYPNHHHSPYPNNRQSPYINNQQTLYPIDQQTPYSNSQQAPYPNYLPAQFPSSQRRPYAANSHFQDPTNSQPPYPTNSYPANARSQQTPYPTSQLPSPYPIADTPYSNADSDATELENRSDTEEPEQQSGGQSERPSAEPAEPTEIPEPIEPAEPAESVEPAPVLTLDERNRATKPSKYRPRRRVHGNLHEIPPEGIDLSRLHEVSFQSRDHLPPPERVYNTFDEAVAAVIKFGKARGVTYIKHRWSRNMRQRLMMVCNRAGVHRDLHKEGTKRRNMAASASKKCECRMSFWILAMDYTNLEGQWRVKWCNDRKSILHNHPPDRPKARDASVNTVTTARIPGFKIA